jgi:3-methyladenine DNA glycosylase AlkD
MEYARLAAMLLTSLRRETNGAVVADMEGRGLYYQRNYGVSGHTVRTAARALAPNHGFAKYLWNQPVRELKLAAVSVADPSEITFDEVKFWLEGVENVELAENVASYLLSRTALVGRIAETHISSDKSLWVYVVILTLVKGYPVDMTADKTIGLFERIKTFEPFIERAAALLLSRAATTGENDYDTILQYIDKLRNTGDYINQRIANEIMI